METSINTSIINECNTNTPKKSIVQVYFEKKHMSFSYFNDKFDLKCGDIVYVEGKLEGFRGRVTEVNYNFKIKPSEYKRVIAQVSTEVNGSFFPIDEYFVTFDKNALPVSNPSLYFKAPSLDEEEYIYGVDDNEEFDIDEFCNSHIISRHAPSLGFAVECLYLNKTKGYAILQSDKILEVEFEYKDGKITHPTCSGYCSKYCEHKFEVFSLLNTILKWINKNHLDKYKESEYFSAINKDVFTDLFLENKAVGGFTITTISTK